MEEFCLFSQFRVEIKVKIVEESATGKLKENSGGWYAPSSAPSFCDMRMDPIPQHKCRPGTINITPASHPIGTPETL